MVQKVKDRLIGGGIGTASGIIVGLVLFFFGGVRSEANAFKDLVDNKVDINYYEKDQERRWSSHDNVHELEAKSIENIENDVEDQNKKIDWLYRNEINKANYSIPPLKD
jgi:hypothetical protein